MSAIAHAACVSLRRWSAALAALALLALASCTPAAQRTPGAVTVATPPTTTPLALPDEARACTRHTDCALGDARVVRTAADCARRQPDPTAVNRAVWQRLEAIAVRLCGPRPHPCACGGGRPSTCCPPVARRVPDQHAACVRARCELRRGASLTEDEQREDAAGRGTDEEGECYLAGDCAAVSLTAFPRGLTDPRGRELCPVCPRPGVPVRDEAAVQATLAPRCPRLVCQSSTVTCLRRRCVRLPQRAARTPVAALPLPAEPEVPPEPVELPRGPDYRCSQPRDCVLGPTAQCSCGAREPVNRGAAERRRVREESACKQMPCNEPLQRPRPVPVCFEGRCVDQGVVAEVRRVRRARAQLVPARQAWERRLAELRAAQSPFDEIEGTPPGP